MAELVANGTTETPSSDFTLLDGAGTTLSLKSALSTHLFEDSRATIQIKAADGSYTHIGELNSRVPAQLLYGPGTFRVVRKTCVNPVGVERS